MPVDTEPTRENSFEKSNFETNSYGENNFEEKDGRAALLAEIAALRQGRQQAEELARGQTEALSKTLTALMSEPDLDKFLELVLIAITRQLQVSSCALWLFDAEHHTAALRITCDQGRILTGSDQMGHPHQGKIVEVEKVPGWERIMQRCPFVLEDLAHNPHIAEESRQWFAAHGVRALLVVPLVLGGTVIGKIGIRSTERDHFVTEEIELASALAQQAILAVQLTRLAEQAQQKTQHATLLEERNRMAREMHDTLTQAFTGIRMQVEAAVRALEKRPDFARSCLTYALDMAEEGLKQARRSVWALQPDADEYSDLVNALNRLCEQMTSQQGVQCHLSVEGDAFLLPPDIGVNLLRIAQEALTNALCHADPHEIKIVLSYHTGHVRLCVHDDGCGFDVEHQTNRDSFGLAGMRKRAERIGADFSLVSRIGQGTQVCVACDIPDAALVLSLRQQAE